MKRNANILIRLTPEEKKEIKRNAKKFNLTITDYIKISALQEGPVNFVKGAHMLNQFKNISFEINKIGVNLNQAIKVLHHKKERFTEKEMEKLFSFHDDIIKMEEVTTKFLLKYIKS